MDWGKVLSKGVMGILTFIVSYLAANPQTITNLIPENIGKMTISAIVAGLIVATTNWLKHRNNSTN